jgi:UDP-2,4-diacetamido-2,4,6-trideoxy-beta-L-altropyranose hydrolase
VLFATAETPEDILNQLRQDHWELRVKSPRGSAQEDLQWMRTLVTAESADVVILDGYGFDVQYQKSLKSLVPCLVCLDDVPGRPLECHIVLNQNLGVSTADYQPFVSAGTRVLAGPQYALLRSEITKNAGLYRVGQRPSRVLVTLGGSDSRDDTARVLAEITDLNDVQINVVLGPFYRHSNPMKRVSGLQLKQVQVHEGLTSLLDLAQRTDLAVTAAGSTVWELACLGVPMVVVGTAQNQEAVLRGLTEFGAAQVLGWMTACSPGDINRAVRELLRQPDRLSALSKAAIRLVDGKGVERMAGIINEMSRPSWTDEQKTVRAFNA